MLMKVTKIAKMPNSWIDDFSDWSNPATKCCKFYRDQPYRFCNASVQQAECDDCLSAGENINGHQFDRLLPFFLADVPSIDCPKGSVNMHATQCYAVKYFNNFSHILTESKNILKPVYQTFETTFAEIFGRYMSAF